MRRLPNLLVVVNQLFLLGDDLGLTEVGSLLSRPFLGVVAVLGAFLLEDFVVLVVGSGDLLGVVRLVSLCFSSG